MAAVIIILAHHIRRSRRAHRGGVHRLAGTGRRAHIHHVGLGHVMHVVLVSVVGWWVLRWYRILLHHWRSASMRREELIDLVVRQRRVLVR